MKAAEKGRADCVRLLLDAGDDKEAKDKVRVLLSARLMVLLVTCDLSPFLMR